MKANNIVGMDMQAAANLRYIRASIDSARSVMLPGSAGFALGLIGCLAAAACVLPEWRDQWFIVWLCAAVPAVGIGGALLLRPASLRHWALAGMPLRNFVLCMAPALFAGAIATVVLWQAGHTSPIRGIWLVTYGCALVSASVLTTSTLARMGCLFVCLGLAALVADETQQALLMGAGFGGLHLVFAILIGQENGRQENGHGRKN